MSRERNHGCCVIYIVPCQFHIPRYIRGKWVWSSMKKRHHVGSPRFNFHTVNVVYLTERRWKHGWPNTKFWIEIRKTWSSSDNHSFSTIQKRRNFSNLFEWRRLWNKCYILRRVNSLQRIVFTSFVQELPKSHLLKGWYFLPVLSYIYSPIWENKI